MAQQTAVEWFYKNLIVYMNGDGDFESAQQIYEQAKAMEKQQIEEAFNSGLAYDYDEAETYYNKTYNK